MGAISIDLNSIELNNGPIFSIHKLQISDKPRWVYIKVEAGLVKKIILSVGPGLLD